MMMPALDIKRSLKDILLAVESGNFRAALAIIGKILQDPTVKSSDQLANVITQLLIFVLSKSSIAERTAFTKSISTSENLPISLVEQLLSDSSAISTPLIMSAPFTDAELIQLIETGDLSRRVAITLRPNLTEPVTDQLATGGEIPVLVGLARNVTAKLSHKSFDLMASVASIEADMDKALAVRSDLPVDIATKLSRRIRAATEARMSRMIKQDLAPKRAPLVLRGPGF